MAGEIITRGPFSATGQTCSANAEQPGYSVGMARMMGLETAADMLGGKDALGATLGISARGVRHKITGDRGVSNGDLLLTASALDKLATRITDHARKLRAEAGAQSQGEEP